MTDVPLHRLVEAAIAAPSVHNVQPARWRIEGDALLLLEDMSRRYSDRIIIFDSPPLLVTTEARALASHMGPLY